MKPFQRRDMLAAASALAIGAATGRLLLDSMNAADPEVAAALSANADAANADAANADAANADAQGSADSLPDRLVIVVIDGLGEEVFAEVARDGSLPAFDWRATVDVGSPSLSRPVYHVLLTGVPQEVSGIRNNAHSGRARADDLAARVREAGGTVGWALETVPWFQDLFGQPEDVYVRLGEEPRLNAITDRFDGPPRPPEERLDAMASVLSRRPRLAVLHFTGVDHAGHHHGATSPEYRAAAAEAVRAAIELRGSSAEGRAVWMIGSDHGHLARGGHGGPEPEVRRTTWIGLWPEPIPAGGSGRSLAPVTIPGVVSADRLAATFAAILRVPPPRQALGEPLPLPDRPSPADPGLEERREAVDRALRESIRRAHLGVLVRAGFVVACLLALIGAALRGGQRRDKALALAGAASAVLCACAGFAALGPGITLSAIRTHFAFMSQSLASMALGAALSTPLLRRWRAPPRWLFLASAIPPAAACAITAGSMGGSRMPESLFLLLPATGIVPWGVLAGTAIARAVSRAASRGQPSPSAAR